jgi:oligoendopeptidase F
MVTTGRVLPRDEVPVEETWNAESVFDDAADWEEEFEAVQGDIPGLKEYEGKLSESPSTLAQYLTTSSDTGRQVMKLYFYAVMRNAVYSGDQEAKSMMGRISGVAGQYQATTAFARPEMLAIGEETILQWAQEHDDLQSYQKYFEDMFRKQEHVRSSEVEEILGMLTDSFNTSGQVSEELTNTDFVFDDAEDSDGNPFEVTQGSIDTALESDDRTLRRTAWENYADRYRQFENTLATAYIASVKQSTFMKRVRGHESVLHMQLFEHNLPVEVFHNLIDTYKKNLPTWHRYWDVKRRALGVEKMRPYDIWAPMTQAEPTVGFEQAIDWISEGVAPLGKRYVEALRKGTLEERWVDRSVNKGKRQGAFSYGTYDTHPFIMMSYDESLGAMSTLAHELGHSMHSYFSRATQPPHYAGYSMFVAEVASNFNQAMTRAHLFKVTDDPDFQIALIQEAMSNFHRYFFIMPTLARFEYEVHQRVDAGKPLTADILNGLMADLYAEGYGDTLTDDTDRTGITWAQFGHLYVPFYTFQYATGISAAHALAERVQDGDDEAAEKYVQFLSAGSSVYPLDALSMAGVDMSTPEAVEKTYEVLAEYVDRLEELTS